MFCVSEADIPSHLHEHYLRIPLPQNTIQPFRSTLTDAPRHDLSDPYTHSTDLLFGGIVHGDQKRHTMHRTDVRTHAQRSEKTHHARQRCQNSSLSGSAAADVDAAAAAWEACSVARLASIWRRFIAVCSHSGL